MKNNLRQAARLLEEGKVLSFPTETVYAIAGNALNEAAVSRIYEIKGRDFNKPLAILSPSLERLKNIVIINESACKIAEEFCPGPITLVLSKHPKCKVLPAVNSGLQTLAVRIPDNKIALEILKEANCPVIGTSANPSGKAEAINAAQVNNYFSDKLSMIIDGGECEIGKPSTIVDLTGPEIKILREGSISKEQIIAAIKA
ncbi:MAG: yciO [Rickettsiaceae bacterium]|jgi:L-threonylcarbamoyladenylate synthase|nr:yciO [Rickettsiaceae bacterium]